MDGEDDDFYANGNGDDTKHQDMDFGDDLKEEDGLEEGEEEEDSDDDSIEIIVDDNALAPSRTTYTPAVKPEPSQSLPADPTPKREAATPSQPSTSTRTQPVQLKNGADYPEVHTSTVDVDVDPIYPAAGKPVTQIDIDADLAEHAKPWRLPGADQSDYFNYGFDEFTWASYVLRQQTMAATLREQKDQTQQFQQMFGGIPGMPSMPGAPTAQAAPPSQPQQQQQQQQQPQPDDPMMGAMFQYMSAQGISDPSQVDFNHFMQTMGAQMGMPGAGAPPTGPAGQQGVQGQAAYGAYGGNYGAVQGAGQGGYRGGRGGRRW